MRDISTRISVRFVAAVMFLFFNCDFNAQCADTVFAGRSINALTQVANKTKPVAVDKNLNTAVFVYRIDSTGSIAASGMFRYGISTNNGNTFNTNSKVLNPISTSWGRYPSAVIYNPTANTTPSNAHMGYFGSTASVNGFDGIVTGASQVNSNASTENYNQPGPSSYPTTNSVIRSVGGNFWSTGIGYTSGLITNNLLIYKGIWNGSNDITWATNTVIPLSANTNTSGMPVITDCRIAFAPNGTIGWVSVLKSPAGSPGNNRIYPVFYKTTDGGQTWTGPILFDQNQYSCITSNMIGASLPALDRESDLTVDINGNPHLLVTIGHLGTDFNLNYNQWHNLFDITLVHGIWTAYEVAALKASPGDCGNNILQVASPQVSRTADGSKVFFGWADNSSYAMGTANLSPNFFARAYDVQQRKWTQVKDFTSCNSGISGKIFFNHLSAEVLEPSPTQYKLAPVFCIQTSTPQLLLPVKLYFLNNSVFNDADFTIPQPEYTVSVSPGLNTAVCPGGTLNLQVINSPDQVLWSNGNTSPTRSITSTGDYFVAARSGCTVGAATITVGNLTLNVAGTTSNVCVDDQMTLELPGNAVSYTWSPGSIVGNPITVTLTANTLFNVVAEAVGGCTLATTMQVNVNACVGMNEFDTGSSIFIYPVPSKGTVTITSEHHLEGKLYSAAGQLVKSFFLNSDNKHQIVIEDLAKGVYILSGTVDNKKVHRKVLVE